jgi:hypothetical protein
VAEVKLELGAKVDLLNRHELGSELQQSNDLWMRQLAAGVKNVALPVMGGNVAGGSVLLGSSSTGGQPYCGPAQGFVWRVTRVSVQGLINPPTTALGATASFAAGAAASAVLPAGAFLSGFDVTAGPATAAGTATVTVSNVLGGPYVYDLYESTTAGSRLSVSYPAELAQTGGAPTVSIAALASGGAGHINVYGTWTGIDVQNADQVSLFKGDPSGTRFLNTVFATQPAWTPGYVIFKPGDYLVASGANLAAASVSITGEALEAPAEQIYKLIS